MKTGILDLEILYRTYRDNRPPECPAEGLQKGQSSRRRARRHLSAAAGTLYVQYVLVLYCTVLYKLCITVLLLYEQPSPQTLVSKVDSPAKDRPFLLQRHNHSLLHPVL